MTIQFNTDETITGVNELTILLSTSIIEGLKRFDGRITRVDVHLSDENGINQGEDDIRCLLEARLENMQPIAVTSHAGSYERAVKGAIEKMKNTLDLVIGRLIKH